jgi:beta-lactamase regulating signal transducer with metallopeptidase domain
MTTSLLLWAGKGGAILLLGFLGAIVLRKAPASTRHALWATVLALQLIIPVAAFLPRGIEVELPPVVASPIPAQASAPVAAAGSQGETLSLPLRSAPKIDPVAVIQIVWVGGTAFVLLRLLAGLLQVRRVARRSLRMTDGGWLGALQRACNDVGVTRPVSLYSTAELSFPVTWGFIYPAILLPAEADGWSEERRRQVLLHELAHVKRFDAISQLLGQCVVAAFWFQPLAWIAVRKLCFEAEHACDDYVLRDGARPSAYASTLFDLARSAEDRLVPAFATHGIARADLERRIEALTRPGRAGAALRRPRIAATTLAASAVLLPIAAIEPSTAREMIPAVATQQSAANFECRPTFIDDPEIRETNGRLTFDDGMTVHYFFLRPASDRCIEASFSVDALFTPDDRDVATTTGLRALVREKSGDRDRAVRIEERGGSLDRRYFVNGKAVAWNHGAEEWYRAFMPEVIRRTSAGIPERARRIAQQRGIDGFVDELQRIRLVDVRRHYLVALLDIMPAATLSRDRFIEIASEELGSYQPMLADTFAILIDREGSNPNLRRLVLDASTGFSNGAERNTVLQALVRHRDRRAREEGVRSIELLGNDSWRVSFLESAAPFVLGDDPLLADAWFDATETISKGRDRQELYERTRRMELPPAILSRLDSRLTL